MVTLPIFFSNRPNGNYHLQANASSQNYSVYCHMTEIPGCGGRGWTLIIKINGDKVCHYWNALSFKHFRKQNFVVNLKKHCKITFFGFLFWQLLSSTSFSRVHSPTIPLCGQIRKVMQLKMDLKD